MELNVVYASDNGYVQHMGVSILSLFEKNVHIEKINIFILDNSITKENKKKLNYIANKFERDISYIDISNIEQLLPVNIDTANLSISTYARLFLANLIPNSVNEILYLDCDTVICDDLLKIRKFIPDNNDWCIAGVEDTMYTEYKTAVGLEPESRYVNAGILYINLAYWRRHDCLKNFLNFINKFDGSVPHLDQGVINGVFKNRITFLPLRYNVQAPIIAFNEYDYLLNFYSLEAFYTREDFIFSKQNPAIIHFTSFFLGRPWDKFCLHPLKNIYRGYLEMSPFNNEESLKDNSYTLFQKIKMLSFKYFQDIYLKLR